MKNSKNWGYAPIPNLIIDIFASSEIRLRQLFSKLILSWKLKIWLRTLTFQIIVQQILLFFGEKNTYTTILGPTRLLISDIFPSTPDSHLHKWEKNPSYKALLKPTHLLISEKSATYTIKLSYTIIWQVRVDKKISKL